MEGSGWVKIYRQLLENPVIMKTNGHLTVWIYFLLNAAHKQKDVLFSGARFTLQAGQLVTTRSKLCNITREEKLTARHVRTILDDFEKERMICREGRAGGTVITVKKWTEYQTGETAENDASDQPPTNQNGWSPTNQNLGRNLGREMPTSPTTAGVEVGRNLGRQNEKNLVADQPPESYQQGQATNHRPTTDQQNKNDNNERNNNIYNNILNSPAANAREEPPTAPEGFEYVGRHKDTGEPSFRKKNPTPEDIDAFFEYFKQTGKPIRLTAEEDYIK